MDCHPILALTPKEREVAALVRDGFSNQEIAKCLSVNYRTIESHLYNASRKLNAKNRTQLMLILDGRLHTNTEITLSWLNTKKLLKARIRELHKQGCNVTQISERTKICYESVRGHLANMGLSRRKYTRRKVVKELTGF